MLCIFCFKERAPSLEHVFPLAIGGTLTTERVCGPCNSTLGSRVDAALSDFFPIRAHRAKLRLAGNGGEPPALHEFLLGKATLIDQTANQVHTTLDKTTGKLNLKQIPHKSNVVMPNGEKVCQITLDARDENKLPRVIQRERKLHDLPPLSEEELAVAVKQFTVNSIENPLVHIKFNINFKYLRHAMIKIAYELAFLWFGESYLYDPLAAELRSAICNSDVASTDNIFGYVGFAKEEEFKVFQNWTSHEEHHLAYASVVAQADNVVIAVRVFDIYAAAIVVSREPGRYFRSASDSTKLRFLAIDAVTGRMIDTTFADESKRLVAAMAKYQRYPPFPDPLSQIMG
jgi:hypothetical protein